MKVFGAEDYFLGHYDKHLTGGLAHTLAVFRANLTAQTGFAVLNALVAAAGSAFVVSQVLSSTVEVGDFVLFGAAVASLQSQWVRLVSGSGVFGSYLPGFVAFSALTAETRSPVRSDNPAPPLLQRGLSLNEASYSYGEAGTSSAVGPLTCSIPAGKTTAIVGDNGSGKTALMALLLGLYTPDSGSIVWDGSEITQFDRDSYRSRFTVVFQEFSRYDVTARDNVAFGDADLSQDSVNAAAEAAGVLAAIDKLPDGWDSPLSRRFYDEEDARSYLSGGQWQRLAITRALAHHRAEILLLDEATSMLDLQSERCLVDGLAKDTTFATKIFITHRAALLKHADHIIIMNNGKVQWEGPPQDPNARHAFGQAVNPTV